MEYIGYIHTMYPEKFGIPRQSGMVDTPAYIELTAPYNDVNAVKDLECFDYIWLIWECSETDGKWHPTARPPKLGGNQRKSIFATRSPFHPNALGLSCVRLMGIEVNGADIRIKISGADIMDGTPLLDIKPYIPYADSHPDAAAGWVDDVKRNKLQVKWMCDNAAIEHSDIEAIECLIAEDPRPGYQEENRVYGMRYGAYNIRFEVKGDTAYIIEINQL